MKKAEFLNSVEEILEEDPNTLDGSESLNDVGWDSITFMSFISLVDSKLGITLDPTDVAECKVVNDLTALVSEKLED